MQAIEFITQAKNGTITIPTEYLDRLGTELKVIILFENKGNEPKIAHKKRTLTSLNIDTKDLPLTRDETNER